MDLSGHGAVVSSGADELMVSSGMGGVDMDSLRVAFTALYAGLSFFSDGVVGTGPAMAADLKSKAVPGVLGVLAAEPKDANAPEPRPNAVEAPAVGEASPPGGMGDMALNGLRPPWDESPPGRLEAEKGRWGASDLSPWDSECDMDRESLLVLLNAVSPGMEKAGGRGGHTWSAGSRGCPCYPLAGRSSNWIVQWIGFVCRALGGIKERTSSKTSRWRANDQSKRLYQGEW